MDSLSSYQFCETSFSFVFLFPLYLDKLLILQRRANRLTHFALYRSHAIPLFNLYHLPFNAASQFVLLCMTSRTIVCLKIFLTYFLNLHKWIATIIHLQVSETCKTRLYIKYSRTNHSKHLFSSDLVFLIAFEYFQNTNLKLIYISSFYINILELEDTYVDTPT